MKMNKSIVQTIGIGTIVTFFVSCRDKNQVTPDVPTWNCTSAKFAIINTTGAWPSQTSYLQSLQDLNISSLDNTTATEIPASASIWKCYGGVYVSSFGAPATLV